MAGIFGTAACGGDLVLPERTYVDVMARLNAAHSALFRDIQKDSARTAILAEFGVSEEDLLEFARVHGEDVPRMRRLWQAIRYEVDLLEGVAQVESPDAEGDRR